MRQYEVTITGKSPLLMHWDNITFSEAVKRWREVPENKKYKVAGDDRSPPWTWLGGLYHDGTAVAMPSDNLMRACMEGGASVLVPGGRSGKTFKAQTQSGMLVHEQFWPVLVDGKPIPIEPFLKLEGEMSFEKHEELAIDNRFFLYTKRAKIGASKHVRVRPRFDRWELRGVIDVWDDQITTAVLVDVLKMAGDYKGLGDWRPSSKTPGPYGRFSATVKEI
jgi:hypothetical protein